MNSSNQLDTCVYSCVYLCTRNETTVQTIASSLNHRLLKKSGKHRLASTDGLSPCIAGQLSVGTWGRGLKDGGGTGELAEPSSFSDKDYTYSVLFERRIGYSERNWIATRKELVNAYESHFRASALRCSAPAFYGVQLYSST